MNLQKILINYKTSSAGFILILGGVLTIVYTFAETGRAPTQAEMMAQITAIFGGIGLLMSRDADKSTEESNNNKAEEDEGERVDNTQ